MRTAPSSVLLLSLLLLACSGDDAAQEARSGEPATDAAGAAASPARSLPVEGYATGADGLEIWYETRGEGAPAIVFVHCWSCDHEFWREQVALFADEQQVVRLDLGGHGRSRGERGRWRIRELAGDVVAVADALGLERMILVGHSMGGPVSLEAARRMPGRVLGVIAAETLHDVTIEYADEEVAAYVAAFEADFAGTVTALFDGMSGVSMDPALREWILARATAADPAVAIPLLADFATLDLARMFSDAGVPIRAINAAAGGTIPVTNFADNRRYADFEAFIVDDVGHFLQLEDPQTFNAHLEEFVRELSRVR